MYSKPAKGAKPLNVPNLTIKPISSNYYVIKELAIF